MVLTGGRDRWWRCVSLALGALAADLACSSAPLAGKACPCTAGFVCCEEQQLCLPKGDLCTTKPKAFSWPPAVPFDTPKVPLAGAIVFAVSQYPQNLADLQVLDLAPDVVVRGWSTWDLDVLPSTQYDKGYLDACHQAGIRFMGGANLAALFRDQTDEKGFDDLVTCNASGALVPHDDLAPGLYWAALANPKVRQRAIQIGKMQIDTGVDGLNMIGLDSDLMGQEYDGNEGFDDYRIADFTTYLLAKYPMGAFQKLFGLPADNLPLSEVPAGDLIHNFNYRKYLGSVAAQEHPLSVAGVGAEWGTSFGGGRASPMPTSFLQTAGPYVYWREIVDQLHDYANSKNHPVTISAEGVYPFVDLQLVDLYDNAIDDVHGNSTNYVPITAGNHLDGKVSLQPAFAGIKAHSAALAPGAPVVVYLDSDWAAYDALPASEREDYWQLYSAEALANGIFYAFNLYNPGDPGRTTAASLGLMPLFKRLAAYARVHADLYRGLVPARELASPPANTVVAVWDQLEPADGSSNQPAVRRRLVHVVNHAYDQAIIPQTNVTVTIQSDSPPRAVHVASPDQDPDALIDAPYTPGAPGTITVTLPSLVAYDVIVVDY